MKLMQIAILALEVFLILLKDRLDPDKAYAGAIEALAKDWRKHVDEFGEAVARRDLDAIADRLADLERRRLQVSLHRGQERD